VRIAHNRHKDGKGADACPVELNGDTNFAGVIMPLHDIKADIPAGVPKWAAQQLKQVEIKATA
jgi:hypothetical protein